MMAYKLHNRVIEGRVNELKEEDSLKPNTRQHYHLV